VKRDEHFRANRSKRSPLDPNLYVQIKGDLIEIGVLYVYNLLSTGNNVQMIKELECLLQKSFEMPDLGILHYCLRVEV
jgi:hypothetical protein